MTRWLRIFTLLALALLAEPALARCNAHAQQSDRVQLRLGVATFLSHDRGWNYGEPVEILASLVRKTGSVELEAGASVSKSFANFVEPAVVPKQLIAYRDGFRLRVGVRAPSASQSVVSALLGIELVANRTEGEVRSSTLGVMTGLGVNFGPAKRAALDVRYVRFSHELGSSKGILPVSLAWRW